MRIIDLRVAEGLELSSFNDNTKKLNEATKNLMMSLSCSGFNTRGTNGRLELLKSIRETVKRQRDLYKQAKLDNNKSGTNGCYNVWPSLIVVHNYGYGIYGKEETLIRTK